MRIYKIILGIVIMGTICVLFSCWSSQHYVVKGLKICFFESGKVKTIQIGSLEKNGEVIGIGKEEQKVISDIVGLINKGLSLSNAVKQIAEEKKIDITIKEKNGNPSSDSISMTLNLIRNPIAESELETLYPIPNQHWIAFKLDPQDTLLLQSALAMYDSVDIYFSSKIRVEVIDTILVSQLPTSFPVVTIEYPDSDPQTGEIIYQWTQPETIGEMQIINEGLCPRQPTSTQWGLILLVLTIAGFFGYMILRRRRAVVSVR